MCPSNDAIEDVELFFLQCSSFISLRRNLLARTFTLIRLFGFATISNESLMEQLYGDNDLSLHIECVYKKQKKSFTFVLHKVFVFI